MKIYFIFKEALYMSSSLKKVLLTTASSIRHMASDACITTVMSSYGDVTSCQRMRHHRVYPHSIMSFKYRQFYKFIFQFSPSGLLFAKLVQAAFYPENV